MKLNKRTRKIFAAHKASYLGMLLLMVLSVSCYLGFKTATTSITQNVADSRINQKLEDASFSLAIPLTDNEISQLEKEYNASIQKSPAIEVENGYKNAALRLIPAAEKINLPQVYGGTDAKADDEIMVDRYFMAAQKLNFGDTLELYGRRYTITGTFTTPNCLTLTRLDTDFMADGARFGLVLLTPGEFSRLPQADAETEYSVIFEKDNEDDFRRALAKSNWVTEWTSREANSRITNFDSENPAVVLLSIIAPVFIMVVGSIIMAVVLSRMLKQEYTYIGTLTAMGYRKREIFAHYLRLPAIISAIGSVLGLGLGFLLIEPFAFVTLMEYNVPKPQYIIKPQDIALALLLPIALNLLFCTLSIAKALRLNIVALLKASGGKEKPGFLTRAVPAGRFSFKTRFRLKEITSNIPRSLLMLLGIIAASLFMVTGFLFYSSIDFLLEDSFNDRFGYEYQYFYKQPQTENAAQGEPFMLASFYANAKDGGRVNFTVHGTAQNPEYVKLTDENGNDIDTAKTVVSQSVARRMGWQKGDSVTITSNANLKKDEIIIDDIVNIRQGDFVFMPMQKLNALLEIPENTHIGVYSSAPLGIDITVLSDVLTRQDTTDNILSAVATLRVFLYILGGVAVVVSLVVVYIVTIMLIDENRKNISMLKVMGYQNNAISRLLLSSTSLLVWLGFAISLPVTLRLINRFFDILTSGMFLDFSAKLVWWQGLLSFAFILLVYYATLLLARRKVLNINMAESLKARE